LQFAEWEVMLALLIMKRFLPYYIYLKKVKWYFVLAVLAGIVSGLVSGAGLPWMMKEVLPKVFSEEETSLMKLIGVALIMPAVFLFRGATHFINSYYISYCGNRVLEFMQVDVFMRIQLLPLQFFHKH
jgi:subfamily B ATP-binding cassette protein MsbA